MFVLSNLIRLLNSNLTSTLTVLSLLTSNPILYPPNPKVYSWQKTQWQKETQRFHIQMKTHAHTCADTDWGYCWYVFTSSVLWAWPHYRWDFFSHNAQSWQWCCLQGMRVLFFPPYLWESCLSALWTCMSLKKNPKHPIRRLISVHATARNA